MRGGQACFNGRARRGGVFSLIGGRGGIPVQPGGGIVGEQAGRRQVGAHVGQLPLQALELGDAAPESPAPLGVLQRRFQSAAQQAAAHGRHHGAGQVDAFHGRLEGPAGGQQQVFRRHPALRQHQARRAHGVAAQQRIGGQPGQPGRVAFHQQADDAPPSGRRVALGIDAEKTGHGAVGDPRLFPVQHPAALPTPLCALFLGLLPRVRFFPGRRDDGRGVAARARFGEADRADPLAGKQRRQKALDLAGGTVGGDVAGQIVVHHQHEGKRQAGRRQFLHHRRQGRARDAMAAQRRRWQQARQPRLRRRAEGFQGHPPLPFPPGGMGSHLLPREVPGRFHPGLLGGGQLGGITHGGDRCGVGKGWMEDSCTMGPVKMHWDGVD